ncbi:MAG: PilZ domain-containing protein [Candidatus Omnitrophica bacterium]|nr:PilZ domain-containing protein [Candidatus Omnitrophota bacterium]
MEEQRQTVRVDINVGVRLRVDAQETVQQALSSRALNSEGIQLLLPGRVNPRERVELEIVLPGQPAPLNASGEVAWVEHLGDVYEGYYRVGVRFLELGESVRQAIEALIAEELSKLKPVPSEAS